MPAVTLKLPEELKARINDLAAASGKSPHAVHGRCAHYADRPGGKPQRLRRVRPRSPSGSRKIRRGHGSRGCSQLAARASSERQGSSPPGQKARQIARGAPHLFPPGDSRPGAITGFSRRTRSGMGRRCGSGHRARHDRIGTASADRPSGRGRYARTGHFAWTHRLRGPVHLPVGEHEVERRQPHGARSGTAAVVFGRHKGPGLRAVSDNLRLSRTRPLRRRKTWTILAA